MKAKLVVGIFAAATLILVSGGSLAVFAADENLALESAKTLTESEPMKEDKYPDEWDQEDPLNYRAYKQMQEESDILVNNASLWKASGITTQWDGVTYTHTAENTANKSVVAGIDVSYHQGNIDWKKVRASGIEYAIIRAGYRAYGSGSLGQDVKFQTYIRDAKNAGIKVGVYIFSQAITEAEAREEADFAVEQIKKSGYTPDLPVVIDLEFAGDRLGRLYEANLSKEQMTNIANAFCERVQSYGYQPMIYASSSWLYGKMDGDALGQKYMLWMARYNTHSYNAATESGKQLFGGQIDVWQCSSTAKVNGISGNVDLDWIYYQRQNVCQAADGNWYYYVDGEIDTSFTGLAPNSSGWWRIENGKVNFDYNGFVKNSEGWWYVEGGQVRFDRTEVIEGTVDGENGWWNVVGGVVEFTDTVAQNESGWWCIRGGKVDFGYTGLAANSSGWWRIEDGHVNFDYQGFVENEEGWWYLEGGHILFDRTEVIEGKVEGEEGWWNVVGGVVEFTDTVAQNESGWWCIRGGKVDFDYTGLAANSSGWWRIEDGHVNFDYQGFAENEHGWWYLEGGHVLFDKTDIIQGIIDGKEHQWYVKGGNVQLTYTGTVMIHGSLYHIKNGIVE